MDSPKLPTDSLYKMLSIGGLVLVISGSLLAWKAIDENATATAVFRQNADALSNAATAAQLKYLFIGQRFQRIETRLTQAINGVNIDALNEFKGGQPTSVPQLTDTLKIVESHGVEFGTASLPKVEFNAPMNDWIDIVGRIRRHRENMSRFLNVTNLTVIPDDLKAETLNELTELDGELKELESSVFALAVPSQSYNASLEHQEWASAKRLFLLCASVFLWVTGIAVFGRASKNWFEQTQRYQDAILQAEAERCEGIVIAPNIPYSREIRWLLVCVLVTLVVLIPLFWLVI